MRNIKETSIPHVMPLATYIKQSGLPARAVRDRAVLGLGGDDNGNGVFVVGGKFYVEPEIFSCAIRAAFTYDASATGIDSKVPAAQKVAAALRCGLEPDGDWLEEVASQKGKAQRKAQADMEATSKTVMP